MHIVVIRRGAAAGFPPVINLVSCLLDLGIRVTLIISEGDKLPKELLKRELLDVVNLGRQEKSTKEYLKRLYSVPKIISGYLRRNKNVIDAVWTMDDVSARDAGSILFEFRHIMFISELVEHVPLFTYRDIPLHSNLVKKLARNAARVVVPEYNRAHIQRVWWDLPVTPAVLPNKPYPDLPLGDSVIDKHILAKLESEKRKIILYQGVYGSDRNLTPYAEAVENLGDDYVLYLMGRAVEEKGKASHAKLCSCFTKIVDLGFVPSPYHLAITPYASIGLLPYVPHKFKHYSIINALYCAPNKIWEYSRFGLPMVGSDVPGLSNIFEGKGIGEIVDGSPEGIADAIKLIDENYEHYQANSLAYYNSVDVKSAVSLILKDAGL